MKTQEPKISRLGERAILLQWDFKISAENLQWLLAIKEYIAKNILKSKVYIRNTYDSLLIEYAYSIEFIYEEFLALNKLDFALIPSRNIKSRLFWLPVCYEPEFGLDLSQLSQRNALDISEIIKLHTAPIYTVYFLGFLPGFPYLGGMDERLKIPRKKAPRKSIPKGAVGIAENQTGIYPKSSPAGWQIIGNCPVDLFDPNAENPSPFKAGDRIRFYGISKAEHEKIQSGDFQLKVDS